MPERVSPRELSEGDRATAEEQRKDALGGGPRYGSVGPRNSDFDIGGGL